MLLALRMLWPGCPGSSDQHHRGHGWTSQALERLRGVSPSQPHRSQAEDGKKNGKKKKGLSLQMKNMEEIRKRRDGCRNTWNRRSSHLRRPGVFQPWERGRELLLPLLLPRMLGSGFPAGDGGKPGALGMHRTSPCAKQSWSRRLALCERGGCKKAISCHCHGNGPAAPGASRSHLSRS